MSKTLELLRDGLPRAEVTVYRWSYIGDPDVTPAVVVGNVDVRMETNPNGGYEQWRFSSIIPGLTDVEHDPCRAFDLEIMNPRLDTVASWGLVVTGAINSARWYLDMEDAFIVDGESAVPCQTCAEKGWSDHLIGGKYMPPVRTDVIGRPCRVRLVYRPDPPPIGKLEEARVLADKLALCLKDEWPGISGVPYRPDVSAVHAAATEALAAYEERTWK